MERDFQNSAARMVRLGVCLAIGVAAWRPCLAQDTTLTPNLPPITTNQTPSSPPAQGNAPVVRSGGTAVAPQDPVSLFTKANPGVELYVAVARLYEENGRLAEAEQQYKKGLQAAPDDLRALLGYARLKDRLGQTDEALNLYRRAVKAHPDEPSVYNNLAVHYAHQGLLTHSVTAMQRAIHLRPRDAKYRDNIATALIQLGRPQEAFAHLCVAHDEASAHYDLGFLMVRIGQRQAAAHQFTIALAMNPSLVPARQWLDRLSGRPGAAAGTPPAMMAASGPRSDPPPEPRMAVRVAPMPDQFGPPPSGGVNAPRSWQEPWPATRGIVPPPGPSWSDAPPVVVRPSDARPAEPQGTPAGEWTTPQRLPPVNDGSAGTSAAPRFPDPPQEDSRGQGPPSAP